MSTDDLTRRAREWAAGPIAARSSESTFTLVSELADEVDRLRAENEHRKRTSAMHIEIIDGLRAERDAARAALERVTELRNLWTRFPDSQCTTGDTAHDLTRALEGKAP